MSNEPKQDETTPADGRPAKGAAFEEALDAAEVFSDLADEAGQPGARAAGPGLERGALLDEQADRFGGAALFEEEAFADEFGLSARPMAQAEHLLAEAFEEADSLASPKAGGVEQESVARAADVGARTVGIAPVRLESRTAVTPSEPEHSIGTLFRPVVKHSPPSRIRVEAESVGALFRRFIEQEWPPMSADSRTSPSGLAGESEMRIA